MNTRQSHGLTLIELLVAIVIFSLLGLMAYKAVYSATESQKRLSDEYTDWQRIARALNRVETELMQIGARSYGQIANAQAALEIITLPNGGTRLQYWRMDGNQGDKLSGIEYSGNALRLLRWKSGDSSKDPTQDVLLEGVEGFDIAFAADKETSWRSNWPVSSARKAEVPAGIKIELQLAGKGRISRVFALH